MDQTPPAEDLPPAVVTFITTEHFALSTSRAAGLSEAGSRVSFFLVSVSSGLVALAFIGQASQLGAAFYVFGLTVLPTLAFLGITTFERILRNGMEDIRYARQINQIRQFYLMPRRWRAGTCVRRCPMTRSRWCPTWTSTPSMRPGTGSSAPPAGSAW